MSKFRDLIYVAIIAILSALFINQCSVSRDSAKAYADSEVATKIWINKHGHAVAEARVVRLTHEQFRQAHEGIVDSLKKEIGNAKIKSIVTVSRVIHDTINVSHDAAGLISFKDKWITLSQPSFNRLVYDLRDSLIVTSVVQRYGFMHLKSKYVTDVVNFNPHVKMKSATSFEITPHERKYGLGLFVGYGVTRVGLSPVVGIGVTYKLL